MQPGRTTYLFTVIRSKAKQKEMNLDTEIDGVALTQRFRDCLNNFDLILMVFDAQNSISKSRNRFGVRRHIRSDIFR